MEYLQYANLVVGGGVIAVLGWLLRGFVDKQTQKANEEQAIIKAISAGLTRLEQLRKPDQATADAAAVAEANIVAQIKSVSARSTALIP